MCRMLKDFYVIAVLFNPMRYKRRVQLFNEFIERMKNYNVNLITVETAFGDRPYEINADIKLRTNSVLWLKENMINIAISRLPSDWKYVAWIDADIDFVRGDWAEETVHMLQHHPIVQMFQNAIDLGPTGEILNTFTSFGYSYSQGKSMPHSKQSKTVHGVPKNNYTEPRKGKWFEWHTGYAWAARRDAIDGIGGLIDWAVVGSADNHMACAWIGEVHKSTSLNASDHYNKLLKEYEERSIRVLHKNIGYVKGTIYHYWHGKKKDRGYVDRWSIIIDNKFDPTQHVHKDSQNLYTLYPGHDKLRNDIVKYFSSRNEDSVDLA